MSSKLILAVPSKGRLMEHCQALFGKAGLTLRKTGHARGYRGDVPELPGIEVAFISASEIASYLKDGRVHLGITGEDLVRETMSDADTRVTFDKRLGFGHADVVTAVPASWIDVTTMNELDEVSGAFRRIHGRPMRVATKYLNITRRFFTGKGVSSYRIVESLGATEGTPAAGTAELIVDITSTGETLRANGLRILSDGVILKSEANLVSSNVASWDAQTVGEKAALLQRLVHAA